MIERECPSCGVVAGASQQFCTECGTTLPPVGAWSPFGSVPGACAGCGTVNAEGLRFCTMCGRPAEAPVPTQPLVAASGPTAPGLDRRPRGSRTGVRVAVIAGLTLALLAGGLAAWFVTRDDDQVPEADRVASASPTAGASPTAPTTAAEPEPESEAETAPAARPGARCWDDSTASDVEACSSPSGRRGLEWVFPSMATQECADLKARSGSPRVQLWECFATLSDGTPVRINYAQWDSVTQGYDHFSDFLGRPVEVTNRFGELALYRWNGEVEGEHERAVIDARVPFSVAVFVSDPAQREPAFEQLVRLRPGDQFRGVATR